MFRKYIDTPTTDPEIEELTEAAIRDLKAVTDKAAAGKELPEVISMIDKLAKTGVIHKNKASNLKSKLTKKVNALA